ncbi:MAG: transposase, partial [Trebonia sp.]
TTHGGRKSWRGYRLIYLTDVKTSLPIGFHLAPAARPEWECVRDLLVRIHELWDQYAGEPWEPEYLIGDAHFDNEPVHRMLEERFAIHPVFPRAIELGRDHQWHENDGTPACAAHGDMKLVQSQYFVDHAKRRELGLRPGEAADLSKASFRWACTETDCPVKATTSWDRSPRAYSYLPHRGVHRSRIALRTALMLRRNVSESLNASLKGRGIGNGGMNVPRWVSTDKEMAWLCYGTSLTFMLVRLAHETSAYRQAHEEADRRGLLTPCEPDAVSAASDQTLTA